MRYTSGGFFMCLLQGLLRLSNDSGQKQGLLHRK